MKLIAMVTNVNQKCNKHLVGTLIIVNSKLVSDIESELCYREVEGGREVDLTKEHWHYLFQLKHSITNIDIIGRL